MIRIENVDVFGWEAAIRGCRNPMNSWSRSDSQWTLEYGDWQYVIGKNDLDLAKRLVKAGTEHSKFMRYIHVQADITAPDYWFKEFSTYRVGVTENSTSTMHRITAKEFTLHDFSCEEFHEIHIFQNVVNTLNLLRKAYLAAVEDGEKDLARTYWLEIIQLLPMSYNYRRTVDLNYQVLANMYHQRKNHRLDEWREFCRWVERLPYSELITGGSNGQKEKD